MGMPARNAYYTVDEVLAFPEDGNTYELAYGKLLVSPSPRLRHQDIVMRLGFALQQYGLTQPVGRVFNVAADLTWGRQDTLVQPDVFVIAPGDEGREWADVRRVSLVAEVVSLSSRQHDAFEKRRVYQDRGVGLYWIIDPVASSADIWTPEAQVPRRETVALEWHPEGASEPFTIELARLFSA